MSIHNQNKSLKILICGAGFAGITAAYWLSLYGHQVVLIERFPTLRDSGAQVDLRAQAIDIIKSMGILEQVLENAIDEAGFNWVNNKGEVKFSILANKSGEGAETITSEYEIMRGDLLRILYNAIKDKVQCIFEQSIDHFEQVENQVKVYFSDNTIDTFDLLIGSDGQGSRIRKAILTDSCPDQYRRSGVHISYWVIPRENDDSNMAAMYNAPGGRLIIRRSHSETETQIYFFLRESSDEISSIHKKSISKQKYFWQKKLQGAGWESNRFMDGLEKSKNFYSHEIVQIKIKKWYRNRVVLLGDAAYGLPPTGWGVSASIIGAYILANEINQSPNHYLTAFENYQKKQYSFIKIVQPTNFFYMRILLPKSQIGISIFHYLMKIIRRLKISDYIAKITKFIGKGTKSWKLPKYQ